MERRSLFAELRRRRVFRVAAAYAVVVWLIIQVTQVAFEAFDAPDWGLRLVIILGLIGFPVALALSWAFDITPTGVERTHRSDPGGGRTTTKPSRPRTLAAGLVVVAGLAAAALTFMRVSDGARPGVQGDPRKSVIVLPFEDLTGQGDLAYLEDGAMNLLGLALSHWDDMRVFDDERTESLLRRRDIGQASDLDLELALELAAEAGVGTVIFGEYRMEGDSLAVEAKVYDLESGERVATEVARVASAGDPRGAFSRLAAAILDISGAPPGERPDLLAQTTRSLDAYRAYLSGTRALQQFQTDSARALFLRAVSLDSTFALAYLKLREVDGWAGIEANPARSQEYVQKAVAHSEGLPRRYAMLVQFHEAYAAGQFHRARGLASEMIERDSTDAEAWYQLGEAHFHHGPFRYPHPDTLGDYSSALDAFRRTLAIDSTYVLAYQHVIDVLSNCAADAPWLCLDDRTVYARPDSLIAEFGQEEIAANRSEAAAGRIDAAFAWVAAAPRSVRARSELIDRLLDAGRLEEGASQIGVLRAQGEIAVAASWDIRRALLARDYAAAGRGVDELLADTEGARSVLATDPGWMIAALLGGGRLQGWEQLLADLLNLVPTDEIAGPDNIVYPRAMFQEFQLLSMDVATGRPDELIGSRTLAWLDALDATYEPRSEAHRTRWINSGSAVLGAYLLARDTTILTRFLGGVERDASRSWRTMDALLAWERDDIETARAALEEHFVRRDATEIAGDPGIVRLFGWARLLENFGRLEEAAAAYALAGGESVPVSLTSYDVRAMYELGRLSALLRQPEQARAAYGRFVEAWSAADPALQPLVDDARAALNSLGGANP